jgi:hypothetical protein
MQPIEWLLNGRLKKHSSYMLSDSDWEVLEGMATILEVRLVVATQ